MNYVYFTSAKLIRQIKSCGVVGDDAKDHFSKCRGFDVQPVCGVTLSQQEIDEMSVRNVAFSHSCSVFPWMKERFLAVLFESSDHCWPREIYVRFLRGEQGMNFYHRLNRADLTDIRVDGVLFEQAVRQADSGEFSSCRILMGSRSSSDTVMEWLLEYGSEVLSQVDVVIHSVPVESIRELKVVRRNRFKKLPKNALRPSRFSKRRLQLNS